METILNKEKKGSFKRKKNSAKNFVIIKLFKYFVSSLFRRKWWLFFFPLFFLFFLSFGSPLLQYFFINKNIINLLYRQSDLKIKKKPLDVVDSQIDLFFSLLELNFLDLQTVFFSSKKETEKLLEKKMCEADRGGFSEVMVQHLKQIFIHLLLNSKDKISEIRGDDFLIREEIERKKEEIKKLSQDINNVSVNNEEIRLLEIRIMHLIKDFFERDKKLRFLKVFEKASVPFSCPYTLYIFSGAVSPWSQDKDKKQNKTKEKIKREEWVDRRDFFLINLKTMLWFFTSPFVVVPVFWMIFYLFFASRQKGEDAMIILSCPGVSRDEIVLAKLLTVVTFFSLFSLVGFVYVLGCCWFIFGAAASWWTFLLISSFMLFVAPILFTMLCGVLFFLFVWMDQVSILLSTIFFIFFWKFLPELLPYDLFLHPYSEYIQILIFFLMFFLGTVFVFFYKKKYLKCDLPVAVEN